MDLKRFDDVVEEWDLTHAQVKQKKKNFLVLGIALSSQLICQVIIAWQTSSRARLFADLNNIYNKIYLTAIRKSVARQYSADLSFSAKIT